MISVESTLLHDTKQRMNQEPGIEESFIVSNVCLLVDEYFFLFPGLTYARHTILQYKAQRIVCATVSLPKAFEIKFPGLGFKTSQEMSSFQLAFYLHLPSLGSVCSLSLHSRSFPLSPTLFQFNSTFPPPGYCIHLKPLSIL